MSWKLIVLINQWVLKWNCGIFGAWNAKIIKSNGLAWLLQWNSCYFACDRHLFDSIYRIALIFLPSLFVGVPLHLSVLICSLVTLNRKRSSKQHTLTCTVTHLHTTKASLCRQNGAKVKSRVNLLRHNRHVSHSKWSWKEATVRFAMEERKKERYKREQRAFTTEGGKHTLSSHFALSH